MLPTRPQRASHRLAAASLVLLALLLAACDGSSTSGGPAAPAGSPVWIPSASDTPSPEGYHPGDWPRFGYDPARSGVTPVETALTPATVGRLHRLWQVGLPGVADSSPALLSGLALPDGTTRDVLYVTTRDGRLLARDAATGAQLWARQPTGPKITHSSPVLDPSRQYVYAYGLDSYVHKYGAATGVETRAGGWPVQITRMRDTEKESSALNIANGYLYVTTSGYIGDAPPYQGHVVAVRLADTSVHIFNSLCSNVAHLLAEGECSSSDSGIWARGGAVVDPASGNLFVTTGNGPFDGRSGGHDWGDSVLELSPDASRLLDSYTPSNYQMLDDNDADLGSAAPALLPKIANSKTPYLLVQGGKDETLRLLNRQNLNGAGKPGAVAGEVQALAVPGCDVFTQPVVWQDGPSGPIWVFVAATCGLRAYHVNTDASGASRLVQAWASDAVTTTPVLAGGVLFAATDGALLALDPHDGHRLWSSGQGGAGGSIGGIHWESPIVSNGRLFCPDEDGHLTVYGL